MISDAKCAIELDPKSVNAYLNRGSAYTYRGDVERAIADYTRVLEIDAKHVFAYVIRSNAYLKGARLRPARLRMPRRRFGWILSSATGGIDCAMVRLEKSEISEGLSDATRATQLNPRDGLAWDARSEAELLKSRFSEAMTDALSCDRDRQWTGQCASATAVLAYRETGEFGRSVADLTKAISLEPKNGQLYAVACPGN